MRSNRGRGGALVRLVLHIGRGHDCGCRVSAEERRDCGCRVSAEERRARRARARRHVIDDGPQEDDSRGDRLERREALLRVRIVAKEEGRGEKEHHRLDPHQ